MEMLGHDWVIHLASSACKSSRIGGLAEYAIKVHRAARQGDDISLRLHARHAAEVTPGLLTPLNPEGPLGNPWDVLKAIPALPVCPEMYQEDILAALGLRPRKLKRLNG